MPPRKRRGRPKKACGDSGKKIIQDDEEVQLESEVAAEVVDPELLEAQSTIERLAKKYLHKSFETSSQSLDIVKGDSTILKGSAESEGTDVLSDGIDDEGKENRQSQTKIGDEVVPSPEIKPTLRKRKKASIQESPTVILRRVRHPRTKRVSGAKVEDKTPLWEKPGKLPFASPDFKLPQPTLGHSTPGDMGPSEFPQRDSLFGFDALESPLVLSPVPSMSYMADLDASHASTRQRDSLEKVKNSSSARRFLGTYDIPIRKQTQRNKRKNTKQKNKRSSLAEEDWIKKLTSEFSEVDKFELPVE